MAAEGKMDRGTPQHIWSTPLIDTTSGFCLAWSVCAALYARERTGRGQRVESTLLGSALALLGMRFLQVESLDREPRAQVLEELAAMRAASASYEETLSLYQAGHQPPPGGIYYRVYMAEDGAVAVGCLSDPLRHRLLDVLGLSDIRFEPGYDPTTPEAQAFARELEEKAEGVFRGKTVARWLDVLEARGIPAGPVRFVEELVDDPQVEASGLLAEVDHREAGKVKMVGPLARFSDAPLPPPSASPALGQHAAEILRELGYGDEDVGRWRGAGIVG
jgi:formyl-CoA transferase